MYTPPSGMQAPDPAELGASIGMAVATSPEANVLVANASVTGFSSSKEILHPWFPPLSPFATDKMLTKKGSSALDCVDCCAAVAVI